MYNSTRCSLFVVLAGTLLSACGGGGGSGNTAQSAPAPGIWSIPADEVVDGGPGPDGIPAIESPEFESAATIQSVDDQDLVVVVRYQDEVRVYPHDILNYHEVVNDGAADDPFTLSYCPLTGSATVWKGNVTHADSSFGTSGLLYNSNLIMYDRETRSFWSQMLQSAVSGDRIRENADKFQVIETVFATLRQMYPDARVMTRNTHFTRDYDDYPYGNFRSVPGLLFPVSNTDNRLHPKTRVIGVRSAASAKVYQLREFGGTTVAINDQVGNLSVVVVGSSADNFSAIYDRTLTDGTVLNFTAIQDDLPNVLSDSEGNTWDIFGRAVSGPRTGEQLLQTESYVSYWFAWVAFFANTDIHFNPS